jgi:ABC transporter DrrB family efflux protein
MTAAGPALSREREVTPGHGRVSVGHAVRDTLIITKRNLLRFTRMPQLVVFATIQPVMFLLLFNFVFGGAIMLGAPGGGDYSYIDFLIPGILVQTVVFGATNTAAGLTEDLAGGVIDRFRSLPMARSAVLGGRTLADLVRSAGIQVLMIAVGFVIGFQPGSVPGLILGLVLALLFGYSLSWVFAALGLAVKNPEAAQGASFFIVIPFTFASSVFVPPATMPDWLRVFAENQPVSVLATTVRGLTFGIDALPTGQTIEALVIQSIAWIVGILLVFGYLGVRIYKRAVS